MNCVEIFVSHAVKRFALVGFWDCGECPKQRGKLIAINPLAVTAHLKLMLVISEFSAPHCMVQLLGRPVRLLVQGIGCIAGVVGRKNRALVMTKPNNILTLHCGEEVWCTPT
jgi:hypothetical protein